jgi:hypothetical protein
MNTDNKEDGFGKEIENQRGSPAVLPSADAGADGGDESDSAGV